MIQPISTLREHPRVRKLPTPQENQIRNASDILEREDPENLEEASDAYRKTLQNRRITNLDDYLMDDPNEPEQDSEGIKKNQKLARNAALLQVLDGITDTVHLNRKQENATVSPSRYGDLGLHALDNLRDIDNEFKVDMNKYNQRSQQVDDFNRQQKLAVGEANQALDETIAKQDYEQYLEKATAEKLAQDEEKKRFYESGIRSISNNDTEAADFYLEKAGLSSDEIKRIKGSGDSDDRFDFVITPQQEALYEEYRYYSDKASDEDYYVDTASRERVARRGSPSWHADKIMEALGEDFYMVDFKKRPERERSEQERIAQDGRQRSEDLANDPKVIEGVNRSNETMMRDLANELVQQPSFEAKQNIAAEWLSRNAERLEAEGLSGEELATKNEEMFQKMLLESRGGSGEDVDPSEVNRTDVNIAGGSNRQETEEEPEETTDQRQSNMRTTREAIENFDIDSIPEAEVQDFRNAREELPRHLKQVYDVADKYLEQKGRYEQLRENGEHLDLSVAERETERLLKRVREMANRIPTEKDRQALQEALPFNIFED